MGGGGGVGGVVERACGAAGGGRSGRIGPGGEAGVGWVRAHARESAGRHWRRMIAAMCTVGANGET